MKVKAIVCISSLMLMSSCGGGSHCGGISANDNLKTDNAKESYTAVASANSIAISSSSASSTSNEFKKVLQSQREKWSQRNIHSYQFTFNMGCFCLPDMTQKKQVTVINDIVKEAFFLQSSQYLTQEELTRVKTIDELFDVIDHAISSNPYSLSISYNSEYGYPETISIDQHRDMADDEFSYYVNDFM